jgi:hypothetical protein
VVGTNRQSNTKALDSSSIVGLVEGHWPDELGNPCGKRLSYSTNATVMDQRG